MGLKVEYVRPYVDKNSPYYRFRFYKLVLRKNVNTLHVYYKSGSDEILTESPGAERVPYLVNEQGEDDDVPMLQLEDQDLGGNAAFFVIIN